MSCILGKARDARGGGAEGHGLAWTRHGDGKAPRTAGSTERQATWRPGMWHMLSLQKTASRVPGSKGSGFEASITCRPEEQQGNLVSDRGACTDFPAQT